MKDRACKRKKTNMQNLVSIAANSPVIYPKESVENSTTPIFSKKISAIILRCSKDLCYKVLF